jgi:hypothetical protein
LGLRKFLTADAVAASNSIEGFKVSTQDVQDLMEGERNIEVSDENREETLALSFPRFDGAVVTCSRLGQGR